MTQQIINLGSGPDTQTGDTISVAFTKVNENFSELYQVFEGNSVTSLNANVIFSNNIVTSANIRSGNLFTYGNLETIGTIITAGVFYSNGQPIGYTGAIDNDVLPTYSNLFSLGNSSLAWTTAYLSSNINLSGANIAVESNLLLINGVPVGNFSNSNVAAFLPIYSGNLNSVDSIIINSSDNVTGEGTGALVVNGGAKFGKDVRVGGNLYVSNLVANSTLVVQDPLVYLTANVPYPYNYDIGFYSQFDTTGNNYQHTGLIRDYRDNVWKLFSNVVPEPSSSTIDLSNAVYDILKVGSLQSVGNISGTFFFGNGIVNGISRVDVNQNGNVSISSGGVLDVANFTPSGGNLSGDWYVTGTIKALNYVGNVSGNLSAPGADTDVIFNDNSVAGATAGFKFNKFTNVVTVANTVVSSNLAVGSNVFIVNGHRVGINTASFIDGAILQINSTDSILLPVGSSDERPANAQPGMLRYNTLLNDIEYFDGSTWAQPITQFTISVANAQPGTGSRTVFDLPVANATTAGTIISINGIVQQPVIAYSITGNIVTFTEAPSPEDIIDFRIITTSSTLTGITDVYGTTGLYLDQISPGDGLITFKNSGEDSLVVQANGQAKFLSNIRSDSYQTGTITCEGGIGVKGNVNVNGIMFAVAKNFLIDHPSKDGYKLQHSSLEGPENGVYFRGKLQNSNTIDLPYYWKDLVDENSISAVLTPIGEYQELFIVQIENNKIIVKNRLGNSVNCFYTAWAERKDLDKLVVEYKR
jgi:hypothetical protein